LLLNQSETQMRAAVTACLLAFFAVTAIPESGQAAPAAPALPGVSAASAEFTLVRGGCGPGWHPARWRDRYGRWHVRCVRNY
jgi:hypothetical protein